MTCSCSHDRCWREASVYIPDVGGFCSTHALTDLSNWPAHRYLQLTASPVVAFHNSSGGAVNGAGSGGKGFPSSPPVDPAPLSVDELENLLALEDWGEA